MLVYHDSVGPILTRQLYEAVSGHTVSGYDFTGLEDTPDSYSGAAMQFVRVTAGEDGLEFSSAPGGLSGVYVQTINSVAGVATLAGSGGVTISEDGQTITVSGFSPDEVGEDNTASNVGVSGVGIFKQKAGVDLEFKKILGDSVISVSGSDNNVNLTFVDTEIDHDLLQNIGLYSHDDIDTHILDTTNPHDVEYYMVGSETAHWNAEQILNHYVMSGTLADGDALIYKDSNTKWNYESIVNKVNDLTGELTVSGIGFVSVAADGTMITVSGSGSLDDLNDVAIDSPITGELIMYSGGQWVNTTLSGLADTVAANTDINELRDVSIISVADNDFLQYDSATGYWVNAAPSGIYYFTVAAESGTDQVIEHGDTLTIEGNGGILVETDAGDTVLISTVDNEIDHNDLANFVADEHIDHTTVTISAGDGLTGGGTIAENRTISVNVDDDTIEIESDTLKVKDDIYYRQTELNSTTYGSAGASLIGLDGIGTPSFDSVQAHISNTFSAGVITGFEITDSDSGQIAVASGTGLIRTTDNEIGDLVNFDFAGADNIDLTNNAANWIYVGYSGGTPVVSSTTDLNSVSFNDEFIIGRVYRDDNELHIVAAGQYYMNNPHILGYRMWELYGLQRASGMVLTETGDRNLDITAGVMYIAQKRHVTVATDTSDTDTFSLWYRDGGTGWTESTGETQIPNTVYDDDSGTPATLDNNKYGVFWVYQHDDGDVHVIMGQDSYTLADALDSTVPEGLPNKVISVGLLIARITIAKNETSSFTNISTPWNGGVVSAGVTVHNGLGGLDGGTANEYYHLTNSEHTELTGWLDNVTLGAAGALTLPTGQNFAVGSTQWNTGDNLSAAALSGTIPAHVLQTEWDAAYTHVSSDGSDHTYIDQDVTIGATPTFSGMYVTKDIDMQGNGIINIDQITPTLTQSLQVLTVTGGVGVDIISTQDGTTGAILILRQDSASPATWDTVGRIDFKGEDDASNQTIYAKIEGLIYDSSNGSEDGLLDFYAMKDGAITLAARLGASWTHYFYTAGSGLGMVIQNTEDGATGCSLTLRQVSASPATNDSVGYLAFSGKDSGDNTLNYAAIYGQIGDPTNGSEDGRIRMYVTEDGGWVEKFRMDGGGDNYLYTTIANTGLYITNTQDSSGGAILTLYQNSASPAAWDNIGKVSFRGEDSASNNHVYAYIVGYIYDPTNGAEDGGVSIYLMEAGAEKQRFQMYGGGDNYLYTTAANTGLYITNTQDGATGAYLTLYQNSASPAAGDVIGSIEWRGENDASANHDFVRIDGVIANPANGAEDGRMSFYVIHDGSMLRKFRLDDTENYFYTTTAETGLYITNTQDGATGATLTLYTDSASPAINDAVASIVIKGNDTVGAVTYSQILCSILDNSWGDSDGLLDFQVTEHGSTPVSKLKLTGSGQNILYASDSNYGLRIQCATDGVSGALLDIYTNSASPAAADIPAKIRFAGENDATEEIQYAHIDCGLRVVTDGSEQSRLRFYVMDGGVDTEMLQLDGTDGVYINADGALELVSVGANDSGGAGFKYLRIPN